MRANYYAHIGGCKHCGHSDLVVHLGKSSLGWRFAIEVSEENKRYFSDWSTFRGFICRNDVVILDDYGLSYTAVEFVSWIEGWELDSETENKRGLIDGPVDLIDHFFR